MDIQRYWVLGGQYADTDFHTLRDASPTVAGPFLSEEEAKDMWRSLSAAASSVATTRFSILSEKLRRPG